jgi:hypothetical protein
MPPTAKINLLNCSRDYGAFVLAVLESGKTSGRIFATSPELSVGDLAHDIARGKFFSFSLSL